MNRPTIHRRPRNHRRNWIMTIAAIALAAATVLAAQGPDAQTEAEAVAASVHDR